MRCQREDKDRKEKELQIDDLELRGDRRFSVFENVGRDADGLEVSAHLSPACRLVTAVVRGVVKHYFPSHAAEPRVIPGG